MRTRRWPTFVQSLLCLCPLALPPCATSAQQPPRLTVSAGHLDVDGLPASGARLCVDREMLQCYQMASMQALGTPEVVYQFGLDPALKQLNVPGGASWVLFSATYSGGGSGLLTRYAILRRQGIHFTDLLPPVALTDQSDHAVWNDAALSPYPLFVTADFFWDFDAGETHFSKHRFDIAVWRYVKSSATYTKVLSYRTVRKYDGEDSVSKISVLTPERPEILRRLRALSPKP